MNPQNAGLLRRFLAYFLDKSILLFLYILPFGIIVFLKPTTENDNNQSLVVLTVAYFICIVFLSGAINTIYSTYLISKWGGTLGKLLFGIKIQDYNDNNNINAKRAFYRSIIGYLFSMQFFGLGFWKIVKNSEKRGWHDELFNTKVVKFRSPIIGAVSLVIISILLAGVIAFTSIKLMESIDFEAKTTKAVDPSPDAYPPLDKPYIL